MATWSDAGLVAIGVAGTLAATWIGRRYSREDRKAADRAARVERVAKVIGRVRTFLTDADPDRFVVDARVEGVRKVMDRWEPLRDELAVVAASEPASELRDAMARIEVEVANLLPGLMWQVSPELRGRLGRGGEVFTETREHHKEAERAMRLVLDLVHGEGNTRATRPAETSRDEEVTEAAD